ncbi:thiol-disulfide oxidoreductase DCC family protein [Bacillus massiliglaciei]|uniref:thiol-disulfide oxidoreductase DCC family protein n=1 Tax=Bacillus massiliglaciei TaxID=1816693 RepID=UPI000DA631F8|nr:DUF393 domain-containing protein [Bacillus massiliglaciei]
MKDLVLYDGQCILCRQTKKRLESIDWLKRTEWQSLQEYEQQERAILFKREDLRREMHLITPDGRVLRGFYAVRRIMLHTPVLALVGLMGYLPFADRLGNPLYRWIAKNRHLFFKKGTCKDGGCSL